MTHTDSTAWDLIEAAAAGAAPARERFVRVYEPLIRAQLAKRWGRRPLAAHLDDAVQEVFLGCFKERGAIGGAVPDAPGGFRAYLHAIVRNTARRYEEREAERHRRHEPGPFDPNLQQHPQTSLSRAFDRRTMRAILREAAAVLAQRAPQVSESAVVRVEILRLRFRDELPIRAIAEKLGRDAAWVHHQYAKARREFRKVLAEVVAGRLPPGSSAEIEAHCISLMQVFG